MKEFIFNTEQLKQPAEPLTFIEADGIHPEEGKEIIEDLKAALKENPSLVAINAPAIGINKRIFCIKFNDTIKTFINPIIIKKAGLDIRAETNICFPNKEFIIGRPTEVTVVYYNEDFKYEENKLLNEAAAIFSAQTELLDGVLPTEIGLVSDITEDGSVAALTEDEFTKVKDIYKDYIKAKLATLEKEISVDSAAQKDYAQLKFAENVINGRTQVIVDNPKIPQTKLNKKTQLAINKIQTRTFLNRKRK